MSCRHELPVTGGASPGSSWENSTQWDGFRHVRSPVYGAYGGVNEADHGLHHWARRGIATRGVLADVARWRQAQGRPIAPGQPDDLITPADLAATLAPQGTSVEPGDILLIRTGWLAWYRGLDLEQRAAMAADCAAEGTWDCLFTSAPLNLLHGVASPPNALGIR